MDTRTLDTHACADGVDAIVEALDGDFGAFARDAGHGADADQAVVDFRHLKFEEAAKEILVGARHGDLGVVVVVVHIGDDGADGLTLAEEIAGDGLVFGQKQLVFLIVEQEGLTRPCLVDLAGHQFPFQVFEFLVDGLFLKLENL